MSTEEKILGMPEKYGEMFEKLNTLVRKDRVGFDAEWRCRS